jgi:hypothetical protein
MPWPKKSRKKSLEIAILLETQANSKYQGDIEKHGDIA